MDEYVLRIEGLADDVMKEKSRTVVAGDFNAKSPTWGGNVAEDGRGEVASTFFISADLVMINTPGDSTFIRRDSRSVIDLTAVSEHMMDEVVDWNVLEEETLGCHRYISFELRRERAPIREVTRWQNGPINRDLLKRELRGMVNEYTNANPEILGNILSQAYRCAAPRVRVTSEGVPYWWTDEIAQLRRQTLRCRRELTRTRRTANQNPNPAATAEENYRAAKKALKTEINKSKRTCWANLCKELDQDVYGQAYKIVMRGIKKTFSQVTLTEEGKIEQAEALFPVSAAQNWELTETDWIPPFTMPELTEAANRIKNGKAPGMDGIPAEVVKIACEAIGTYMLEVLNKLWAEKVFPTEWKKTKLVLIEKPKKTQDARRAFRPLCMLNTVAKLYENMVVTRLNEHLESEERLSDLQHGFRKKRSTVMAIERVMNLAKEANRETPRRWCALVTVDVKNAFNSANWGKIISALKEREVPNHIVHVIKSYLSNRSIHVGKNYARTVNTGVPQGSVLGPTLWNAAYDGIFRLNYEDGVTPIRFADDIALVIVDKNKNMLRYKIGEALNMVEEWLASQHLHIAREKTEAVLLKGARRGTVDNVEAFGYDIPFSNSVKYLGVRLDQGMSFGLHLREVAKKAEATVDALRKILPNIGGPGEAKRRMLCTATHSIMLYGAPVWEQVMRAKSYRQILQKVHRKMVLRVCSGYRTLSYEAASVLASVPPIHLLAWERREIHITQAPGNQNQNDVRQRTMIKWQEEWSQTTKAAWTRQLIPELGPWVNRKHGAVSYYLTQALTGHGSFQTYTYKIKKTADNRCRYCEDMDSPDHTLFRCDRWLVGREEIRREIGEYLAPENMVINMLRGPEEWRKIENFVMNILSRKDRDERDARQIEE